MRFVPDHFPAPNSCVLINANICFGCQVSVSEGLHEFLHALWEKEAPIRELS